MIYLFYLKKKTNTNELIFQTKTSQDNYPIAGYMCVSKALIVTVPEPPDFKDTNRKPRNQQRVVNDPTQFDSHDTHF